MNDFFDFINTQLEETKCTDREKTNGKIRLGNITYEKDYRFTERDNAFLEYLQANLH